VHSASGRRSHSTTENLRESQSPGTPARPGSPQETNTRAVVVGTALDSWNSGMTDKAATLSGAQMHGDRTYAMYRKVFRGKILRRSADILKIICTRNALSNRVFGVTLDRPVVACGPDEYLDAPARLVLDLVTDR